eukprot:gene47412-64265_t
MGSVERRILAVKGTWALFGGSSSAQKFETICFCGFGRAEPASSRDFAYISAMAADLSSRMLPEEALATLAFQESQSARHREEMIARRHDTDASIDAILDLLAAKTSDRRH